MPIYFAESHDVYISRSLDDVNAGAVLGGMVFVLVRKFVFLVLDFSNRAAL